MLKQCSTLLILLALVSCARQVPQSPVGGQEPMTAQGQLDKPPAAIDVPLSPLDPAVEARERDALTDVWQRIRRQITIQVPPQADVRREIAFFASKQKFFNDVATRAEPYLYLIVAELEKRRMPVELALLPMVESAYNPAAQGNGPAGLWQMVPQTARNFGLKVQAGYDGRKDAIASTLAVLDYLQHLHDTLGNDWLNAVAAYNTGEGRIISAIERNKARGKPTDYWNLKIPARYVQTMPKWLAMISMVKDPEHFQIKLPPIANRPAIAVTQIAGAVQLQQAAEIAGVPMQQLLGLNPAFRLKTTPSGSSFPLILPLDALQSFEQQKHLLKTVKVASQTEIAVSRYKVKSGDTLGSIAGGFKTTVAQLRKLNNLKTDQLKPGQTLKLPGQQAGAKSATSRQVQSYQVKSGENLWTIAKKLRVDSEELRIYNKLTVKTHLQPGQILQVPTSGSSQKTSAADAKTTAMHTVKKGDSLDRIAKQYKIKLADLLKWNQLRADSTLKPGQQLRLSSVSRKS